MGGVKGGPGCWKGDGWVLAKTPGLREVHAKTIGLYQVPKLRNWIFKKFQTFGGIHELWPKNSEKGEMGVNWGQEVRGGEEELEDAVVLGGGPHENPMSRSSPKLELWQKNPKRGEMRGLREFRVV